MLQGSAAAGIKLSSAQYTALRCAAYLWPVCSMCAVLQAHTHTPAQDRPSQMVNSGFLPVLHNTQLYVARTIHRDLRVLS
jgi:hypothetical protein